MAAALRRPGPRLTLAAMAAACVASLALALLAEHRFDIFPCAWCVLQRVVYILIAAACLVGALSPWAWLQRGMAALALLLSGGGMAAAVFQHTVAAQQFSCTRSLADKLLSSLELDALMPSVFSVTATCAEANVSVFGLPFALWSLALFALLALGSLVALWPAKSRTA